MSVMSDDDVGRGHDRNQRKHINQQRLHTDSAVYILDNWHTRKSPQIAKVSHSTLSAIAKFQRIFECLCSMSVGCSFHVTSPVETDGLERLWHR